nr:zinc finger protein 37-like [Nerophis lumbriciformis]
MDEVMGGRPLANVDVHGVDVGFEEELCDGDSSSLNAAPDAETNCPADVTVVDLHREKHDPLHVKQEEESKMPYIKQEAEPDTPDIKEEEQQVEIRKFPMGVTVKSEDDEGPSEESGAANPSSDSSFQHVTTKGEGQSQPDDLLAPLSDSDDITSHSSDCNTDEEDYDFDQNASKSLNKSSVKRDTKECAVPTVVTVEDLHPEKHDPLHVKQEEEPDMPWIKQEVEPETPDIKEEKQEVEIIKFPMGVSVKSEEAEGPSDESGAAKPSSDSSFQHLTTKGEGRSQPDGLLAPLSDSDDITSHSSDFNTDEEDKDFDPNASKSLDKSSLKRDGKECAVPTDVTVEDLHPEKHDPLHVKQEKESDMPWIKQEVEPETPDIKEEKQEVEIIKFPMGVSVKSEEAEGPSDESGAAKPSSDSSFEHPTTKGEGPSQPEGYLAPLSDSDDKTSHSSDFNTDEEDDDFDPNASKSLHKSSLKRDAKECADGKPFPCSVCDKIFPRKSNLKAHMRTHTGEKPFVCTFCGKRFTQKEHLVLHTRNHTGEKPFPCSLCDKTFSSKHHLKRHIRTHTGEKPFVCTCCGKRFTQKGQLVLHTRNHTGEKPFACALCGKRFTEKGGLNIHTRTHTGEKPFACTLCDKKYFTRSKLNSHTRTHSGEKPFACTLCGKRFTLKGVLNKHTGTHTGEKPFVCTFCGKRFSQKGHLVSHTRNHTGERPFACTVCGKKFSRKGSLSLHLRNHTGEKPFACTLR